MGRPRKAGKRTKSGRLSRAGVTEDARDVVIQARRRRRMAISLDLGCDIQKWKDEALAPVTRAERASLALDGDILYQMERDGMLDAEQVSAAMDFAARYLRYAIMCGIPSRSAKVASYGAIRGMPKEHDPEDAQRAKDAHMADLMVVQRDAIAGAKLHLFAAAVEGRAASAFALRSALDVLIRFHNGAKKM